MPGLASALSVLMAAPATEVEFNCPWCNTRLALTRADFDKERAVLCPRCSNPIDLDIQRRLAKTTMSKAPSAAAPPPPPPAPKTFAPSTMQPTVAPSKPWVEKQPIVSRYGPSAEPPLPKLAPPPQDAMPPPA